jgi:hypothetical protein
VIREVLQDLAILPENVYNMDKTGVMLYMLGSIQVLVSKDDLRDYRGTGVKRTMVTAIECISANGRSRSLPLDGTMTAPNLGTSTPRLAWSGSSACLIPKREDRLTRNPGC